MGDVCLACMDPDCDGGDKCPAGQQGLIAWIDDKRRQKVAKLLAAVPPPDGKLVKTNEELALILSTYDERDRKWFAKQAKIRPPSPITWALLVEEVRKRGA